MEKHLKNIARTYENWKRNPSKPNPLQIFVKAKGLNEKIEYKIHK